MKFAFVNADATAKALIAGSPSFASQYPTQANAVAAVKTGAIALFKKGYKEGVSAVDIIPSELHNPIWRGVGVSFSSVTNTSIPTEDCQVGFEISSNPIIHAEFYCALPLS